ncbi:carbon-nitrogen hydrolase [Neokomagataea thailandica NBRC 106555]|uniref:Carbon-nitrogen hydrolase family protein n=2 Tax=Neokomagataea TaxID=1223423 RepID=A0A4Y6V398_9PROT|nr:MULTISPECIES: carbon-nitrogen hydrolase family protein [Neokomagataea]QDH24529.1 carbon-nitrogen hydrolase family protein [Neokomagataea tanensis]GBR51770.1 carbon-nitrogen hydrolase [Neokomagataea thailandica NBRC 106555]
MRIALIQMTPGTERAVNIAQAQSLVAEAVREGQAELVLLPEVWSCLGGTRDVKLAASEVLPPPGEKGGELYEALRTMALEHGIWVHGGSIGERVEQEGETRLANTTLVFSPDGHEAARYRKIHLFDVVTPNGDGYRESATYVPGEEVTTVDINDVCTGLAICYDMRFAELFLALRAADVKMLLLPAAFTQQTGEAHWEVLLRARAIEMQAWVAACGTTGWYVEADGTERQTYGHSMVINPWGEVVLQLGAEPSWGVAEIDIELVEKTRQRMQVQENRRLI